MREQQRALQGQQAQRRSRGRRGRVPEAVRAEHGRHGRSLGYSPRATRALRGTGRVLAIVRPDGHRRARAAAAGDKRWEIITDRTPDLRALGRPGGRHRAHRGHCLDERRRRVQLVRSATPTKPAVGAGTSISARVKGGTIASRRRPCTLEVDGERRATRHAAQPLARRTCFTTRCASVLGDARHAEGLLRGAGQADLRLLALRSRCLPEELRSRVERLVNRGGAATTTNSRAEKRDQPRAGAAPSARSRCLGRSTAIRCA